MGVCRSIVTADNDNDRGRAWQSWQGEAGACLPIKVLGGCYSVGTAKEGRGNTAQGGAGAHLLISVPGVCYSVFPAKETPNPGRLSHAVVRQTYAQDNTGDYIAPQPVQCSQMPGKVGEVTCPASALIASLPVHYFPVSSLLPYRSTI
jgi:hypothetical protein